MRKQHNIGINIMRNEEYMLPIENEKKLQKIELARWNNPFFIGALTISMSVLDALVLYDILDQAMTQAEYMGKITAFGIALVLNMLPLVIAKFAHQAVYKIKQHAVAWAIIATVAFFIMFSCTVNLRFAYQDQYGESNSYHVVNEMSVNSVENHNGSKRNPKGFAVALLLSAEPLVTSLVNFCLAYISDDELRERLNHLRKRRYELIEAASDLKAYLATVESPEFRQKQLLLIDIERQKASENLVNSHADVLKVRARWYLSKYLENSEGASYVLNSMEETEKIRVAN